MVAGFKTFGLSRHLWVGLVFTILLALVGCGGGDDEEQPTSLTKTEYVKQADAICAKAEQRQRKLAQEYSRNNKNAKPGPKATEALILFAGIPPMKVETKELSDLPPPVKEAVKAKAYVDALENGIKVASKEPGTILISPGAFSQAEEVAKDFGFKTCRGA
jgi:hypothetical protein